MEFHLPVKCFSSCLRRIKFFFPTLWEYRWSIYVVCRDPASIHSLWIAVKGPLTLSSKINLFWTEPCTASPPLLPVTTPANHLLSYHSSEHGMHATSIQKSRGSVPVALCVICGWLVVLNVFFNTCANKCKEKFELWSL